MPNARLRSLASTVRDLRAVDAEKPLNENGKMLSREELIKRARDKGEGDPGYWTNFADMLSRKKSFRKAGGRTKTHKEMVENGCDFVGRFRRNKFVHIRG